MSISPNNISFPNIRSKMLMYVVSIMLVVSPLVMTTSPLFYPREGLPIAYQMLRSLDEPSHSIQITDQMLRSLGEPSYSIQIADQMLRSLGEPSHSFQITDKMYRPLGGVTRMAIR